MLQTSDYANAILSSILGLGTLYTSLKCGGDQYRSPQNTDKTLHFYTYNHFCLSFRLSTSSEAEEEAYVGHVHTWRCTHVEQLLEQQ